MSLLSILLLLLIAGVCGAAGMAIAGYTMGGFLAAIGIGFIGALIGIWISRELALPDFFVLNIGGQAFPVIWAIVGAALFSLVLGLARRSRWGR